MTEKNEPQYQPTTWIEGPGKTFKCDHMTISNVESAKCAICGDLEPCGNTGQRL